MILGPCVDNLVGFKRGIPGEAFPAFGTRIQPVLLMDFSVHIKHRSDGKSFPAIGTGERFVAGVRPEVRISDAFKCEGLLAFGARIGLLSRVKTLVNFHCRSGSKTLPTL